MSTLRNMVDEALDAATIQKILPLVQKMEKRSLEDKNQAEAPIWKQLDTELQAMAKAPQGQQQAAQPAAAGAAGAAGTPAPAPTPTAAVSTEDMDKKLEKLRSDLAGKKKTKKKCSEEE